MLARQAFKTLLFLGLAVLLGCSHGTTTTPPVAGGAPVNVSATDAPPSLVNIISLEVTLTGATLNPGNVSILSAPQKIEIERLQTEAAFLNTVNVPAGTYNSITVMFANPEITFFNNTGVTINAAGVNCLTGTVCEIKPSSSGSATYSGVPFPITFTSGTPAGLVVDVNPDNIITAALGVDFTASNVFTILPVQQGTGELERLDEVDGVVLNLDAANKKFTLHTRRAGDLTIQTDTNTVFDDFNSCAAENFTCLQNNLVVEVKLALSGSGVFLAKKIELEDIAADDELEGVVFAVTSATQFKMVVTEELRSVTGVDIGNPITVNLTASPTFQVDTNGLIVPAGLLNGFQNSTDTSQMIIGQTVQIRVKSFSAGPPIAIGTDRVRLRMSRLTARVSGAPAPPNFNVGTLPALFTANGIATIQVQTQPATELKGFTAVSDLSDGNIVSVRGLLFNATPNIALIADKVFKRL